MNVTFIEKELLYQQQFSKREVLADAQAIAERRIILERAAILGNLERVKSKIFFETHEGSKVIETTIWAVTNNYIIVRAGMGIPIKCITHVE